MASVTNGTAHFFGIGNTTLTNATIQTVAANHEFDLQERVDDENGLTVETRKDNRVKNLTVTMRLKTGYTFPAIGSNVAISGLRDNAFNQTYLVVGKGQQYQNRTHMEQTLTLEAFEGINY
jgi:hypothetical protein